VHPFRHRQKVLQLPTIIRVRSVTDLRAAADERRRGARLDYIVFAAGNRQRAMGILAATTLGRVWLMATIVLVIGIAQRTAGLSSAVLLMALFTISMGSSGIAYLLEPEGQSPQPR